MTRKYQVCKRCVMDTCNPEIQFDENGFCNHCNYAIKKIKENYSDEATNNAKLNEIIKTVKKEGKNKEYDCLIGLSGGIDSSYLAYILVKEFGLKPLAVHLDNGWNSEKAVANIHNIVTKLNIDLITHVINWEEFRDLQIAFLKASVVDLEMLSDHAIVVAINKIAKKRKIKYFLIGANFQTESIMPPKWFFSDKKNSKNIVDIFNKFGSDRKLKTFPLLNYYEYLTFHNNYGQYLSPLTYMKYDKEEAKEILQKEIGWQNYGAKHHESFITKFYQTYILPKKFNIDKRKAHLSSLISADQITRDQALTELEKPLFSSELEEKEAVEYFCKKMEMSLEEFEQIMKQPRREHTEFKMFIDPKKTLRKIIYDRKKN